jgi:hypothetical protein
VNFIKQIMDISFEGPDLVILIAGPITRAIRVSPYSIGITHSKYYNAMIIGPLNCSPADLYLSLPPVT